MILEEYLNCCPSCKNRLSETEKIKGSCYECEAEFSPKQRQYAQENPELYLSKINFVNFGERTVLEMADGRVDGRILKIFGVFAVTDCGIECLTHYYAIDKSRLSEGDWISHMSEKTWVNVGDFTQALTHAQNIHGLSQSYF